MLIVTDYAANMTKFRTLFASIGGPEPEQAAQNAPRYIAVRVQLTEIADDSKALLDLPLTALDQESSEIARIFAPDETASAHNTPELYVAM